MTRGMKIALGCGVAAVVGGVAALIVAAGVWFWMTRPPKPTRADTSDAPSSQAATPRSDAERTIVPRTASRYVLVDTQESAYTVYFVFPAAHLQQVQQKTAGRSGTEIVAWDAFREDAESRVQSRIERYDDTPESQLVPQVIQLIGSAGGPIGVTWNGGIAITYTDYQAAKRAYEQAH